MGCSKTIETEVKNLGHLVWNMMQIDAHAQAGNIADGAFEDRTGMNKDLAGMIDGVPR
jgi:hypothetical protein